MFLIQAQLNIQNQMRLIDVAIRYLDTSRNIMIFAELAFLALVLILFLLKSPFQLAPLITHQNPAHNRIYPCSTFVLAQHLPFLPNFPTMINRCEQAFITVVIAVQIRKVLALLHINADLFQFWALKLSFSSSFKYYNISCCVRRILVKIGQEKYKFIWIF